MRRLPGRALLVSALLVVSIGGCTSGGGTSPTTATSPAPTTSPSTSARAATPTPTPPAPTPTPRDTDTDTDTAPARPAPTRPAKTAGPLTAADLPRASVLGAGWHAYADPGNEEEGYLGNGTPVYRRSPAEVLQVVLPLGCVHRSALPSPAYALAEDYRRHDRQATAMRLRFRTASAAADFLRTWTDDLRRCAAQGRDAVSGAGAPVTELVTKGRVQVSTRLDATDRAGNAVPWTEAKAVLDRDVVILAEQGPADADRLARALRGGEPAAG